MTETKSLDHDKLADYMHKASFKTVAGDFSFAKDGEWTKSRQVWTQFQNVQPNNLDQFREGKVQPILWPPISRPALSIPTPTHGRSRALAEIVSGAQSRRSVIRRARSIELTCRTTSPHRCAHDCTAGRYCGRMSVVFALSWIGGARQPRLPGSI